MKEKKFLLVAILGNNAPQVIKEGNIKIVQYLKKKLKNEPQYKGWNLEVRTQEGIKVVPKLKNRLLTFEEKLKKLKP